uniref:Phospholipid scramblase n=1 Tax=Amphora coffeiformis TaxID=265554 RepID=A0A7S3PBH4_9STRA|mmetsp:Transcript_25912/g.49124  ORF Transcript_25912/g.49124 Transcript_25912/m.49124 type:complete len:261 (-) Transcript_25912:80-862(-)
MTNLLWFALLSFVGFPYGYAWVSTTYTLTKTSRLSMNIFPDIGDMLSGGKLVPQESLPYGEPLDNISDEERTFAVQERMISFTGEDFDIYDLSRNKPYCTVRGAMLHLPGKDKMRLKSNSGRPLVELDRKLVAFTPTYDIYRSDGGEKIGWIAKEKIALTDTFNVYAEATRSGFGPFQSVAYKLEGDFLDRRFVMKNDKGQVVAKVTMDRLIEFDEWDHYQIVVAPGMDPALVVACACVIDEELEEEHKERKRRKQEQES